jgi:uncharacterized protein (TIGR02996 family)
VSDEAALLAAIVAHPDEDTPRLAYADWLDEHAATESRRARAEFIRLQCEAARNASPYRSDHGAAPKTELALRIEALEKEYGKTWRAELKAKIGSRPDERWNVFFKRGFPEEVSSSAETLIAHGDDIFRLAPIRRVYTDVATESLVPLITRPWFRRVRSVALMGGSDPGPDWQVFADHPPFTNIERLEIEGGQLSHDGGARLAAADPFPRLRNLRCYVYSERHGFSGLTGLFGGPGFGQLDAVSLDSDLNVDLDPDLAGLIARAAALERITDFGLGSGGITAEAARAVAAARFWPGLRKLYLPFAHDSAAVALASAGLPPLRHLNLSCNRFSPAGVEALANCPQLGTVEVLDLGSGRFGDEGVRALIRSPHIGNLRRLDLTSSYERVLGPEGAKAVAACPLLAGLLSLEVWHNEIRSEGALALAESPYLGGLEELMLDKAYGKARKRLKERFGARVAFL